MATREMALEKNVYLKSVQVNILKSVTIMKNRGDRIQADYIGAQCLDVLDMLLKRLVLELVFRYWPCTLVKIFGLGCKVLLRCVFMFQLRWLETLRF